VARDRKRAKQRRERRAPRGAPAAAHAEIHRADVPGALEHASGEVEEFDAALVRGAGGVPMPAEAPEETSAAAPDPDVPGLAAGGGASGGNGAASELLPAPAGGGRPPARRGGVALEPTGDGAGGEVGGTETAERAVERREHRRSLPARAVAFLRASWAELQRVQWPDRPQVSQATAVVLGFVAVAGVYLGAADWVAQKIINFIL
jgi:preprotein translocase subunit SecE